MWSYMRAVGICRFTVSLLLAAACAPSVVPSGVAPRLEFQLLRPASEETDRALRLPCGPARQAAAARGEAIYLHADVERAATHNGMPVPPRHPGMAGEVTLEFVIDTLGQVDRETIRTVAAVPDAVVASAVEAVLKTRYLPAYAAGRAVAQCVEQSYKFDYWR